METRNCQNCKIDFTVEPDDFSFYEKIKVPPPTWCPECRLIRRMCWRNERIFYRRDCTKTGKSIVSIYSPESPFSVYDLKEWWSDSWDPKDYGVDFDFSRPFFEQFRELQIKVPRLALQNKNNINSDFSNHTSNSKDAYMSVGAFNSENCMYSNHILVGKNSVDVYRIEGSGNENLYECINVTNCYNCQFCFMVENSLDCFYSFDLKNCSHCFLSYNLRGQSFCFKNKKYPKEEYFEKIKEFNLKSYETRRELYKKWKEIIFEKALLKGIIIESSVNSTGNFLFHSKNAKNCFDSSNLEDSKYISLAAEMKDSFDVHGGGFHSELLYECHGIAINSSHMRFSHLSYENMNLTYCDSCYNSNELFGCVGVKKGNHMILNKQYQKDEYFIIKEKIIEHMKSTGEWGQFFPSNISPFAYNETQAQVYFPLTKEEAEKKGYLWRDTMPGTFGKETIKSTELPDTIEHTTQEIINEVLACERTGRNYNITLAEFIFYKQHDIPIPRLHPTERYKNRIAMRPDRKLYNCVCAVTGVPLITAYPPERRPKMIVSDEVYKREVL